jgi:hypothetical protein
LVKAVKKNKYRFKEWDIIYFDSSYRIVIETPERTRTGAYRIYIGPSIGDYLLVDKEILEEKALLVDTRKNK